MPGLENGTEKHARTGRMMAEDGLTVLKEFDAIYFGQRVIHPVTTSVPSVVRNRSRNGLSGMGSTAK
jgi:isocitrate/isopropylmalate dehydrogenase